MFPFFPFIIIFFFFSVRFLTIDPSGRAYHLPSSLLFFFFLVLSHSSLNFVESFGLLSWPFWDFSSQPIRPVFYHLTITKTRGLHRGNKDKINKHLITGAQQDQINCINWWEKVGHKERKELEVVDQFWRQLERAHRFHPVALINWFAIFCVAWLRAISTLIPLYELQISLKDYLRRGFLACNHNLAIIFVSFHLS